MRLKSSQKEFKQLLLNPELAQTYGKKWLHNTRGISAEDRLSVYRTNLFVGLTDVLRAVYPLCEKVIGEQAFKQLAHQYIHYQLPTDACLYRYGEALPEVIKTIPTLVTTVPYLSDLAEYEWLCHTAYHAPIEENIARNELCSLNENKFARLPLSLNASCGLMQSAFPLKTMATYIQENPDDPMTYKKGNHYFMIHRCFGEVVVEEISETFFQGLQFLKTNKGKSRRPQTTDDLGTFMINQGHCDHIDTFIHFLFARSLIKQA